MTSAQAGLVLQHLRRVAGTRRAVGPPDRQLLERFAARRDGAAFAALVRRHGPMVLNVCRGVLRHEQDAEDAFQATFLVLARRAASIRRPEAVAGWLYEVAHHAAARARADAARRRAREREAPPMAPADPTLDMTLRDLRAVLHEELRRLPDKYRVPLVLCYLEGRSQEEAAGLLGWSKGTFRGRLDRGRERLRRRLTARGVGLSALLCAAAVAPRAAAEALVDSAVRAADMSAVPVRVSALAEGVTKAMGTGKLKIATALLLAVGLVVGAGALARQALSAQEPPAGNQKSDATKPQPDPAATRPPADEKADAIEVSGRVVDPDGKAFAGAKVFFARTVLDDRDSAPPPPAVTSDAEGRFRLRVSRTGYQTADEKAHWMRGAVVALGQGYGPGFVRADGAEKPVDVTIKLIKDVPIEGRVVDLQGKPVAGARVQVRSFAGDDGPDLKPFVDALQKKGASGAPGVRTWLDPELLGLARPVVTGADGKFRLTGIGGERLVSLRIEGPAIETSEVYAMTRPAPTVAVPAWQGMPEYGNHVYHGNTFEHAAAPSRPVVGVVRDKDTGKPLAGVTVQVRLPSALGHRDRDRFLRTTTDADGRYEIAGLPRDESRLPEWQRFLRVLPAPGQPYLPAAKTRGAGASLGPVTVDFALKRGVLIRGRVTDKVTGRPVAALVRYGAFVDNPHLKEAPGFANSDSDHVEARTAEDGSFRLVGLPGHGLLAAKGADREQEGRYITGAGAAAIKGPHFGEDHFNTEPSAIDPSEFNTLAEVNPAKDAESVVCDLVLDPGKTVTGTIVDPDGQPVRGAGIDRVRGVWLHLKDLPTAEFRVPGVDPKHPRWYFFRHEERNLGAVVRLTGDEPGPVTVRLQKCGTVVGRVVDDDGLPRAAWVTGHVHRGQLDIKDIGVGLGMHGTGKDGRFRMEGILPGLKIGLLAGKNTVYFDTLVPELTLKPGEVRDVGDVKAKPSE